MPQPTSAAGTPGADLPAVSARAGLCLTLLFLTTGCEPKAAAAEAEQKPSSEKLPTLVKAIPLQPRQVQGKISTTAYLEAEHRVVVIPRIAVPGRVSEVLVDEGDTVKKGDLLARIDDREVNMLLQEREAEFADQENRLEFQRQEVKAIRHRESEAKVDLEKAKADLARLENLDPELVSPRDLDDAKFNLRKTQNAAKVAAFEVTKAELNVRISEAAVAMRKARLEQARLQASEHTVRAPISGVVHARHIKGGELITNGTETFELVDTSALVSYLERPQRELGMIQSARQVVFRTDAFPGRTFHAKVDLILPIVDRETGTFRMRVRVEQSEVQLLRPGLFMRAEILTEDRREALMVPKTAVLAEGDAAVVFFVRKPEGKLGRARRLVLETGLEDEQDVECLNTGEKGLMPGDLLIVSGQEDLSDKAEVELSEG